MPSYGQTRLSNIWDMLNNCAKDRHRVVPKEHYYWVYFTGKQAPFKLPRGEHGRRDPETELGHVKKIVRYGEIKPDCAKQFVPI